MISQEDIDNINDELDSATDQQFSNVEEAWETVAMILESNNIEVPQISNFDDEMLFKLVENQDTPHKLYVAIDEEDGKYSIYATLATNEELDELDQDLDEDE